MQPTLFPDMAVNNTSHNKYLLKEFYYDIYVICFEFDENLNWLIKAKFSNNPIWINYNNIDQRIISIGMYDDNDIFSIFIDLEFTERLMLIEYPEIINLLLKEFSL